MTKENFTPAKTYTMRETIKAMHAHRAARTQWLHDKPSLGIRSKYIEATLARTHDVVNGMQRTHRGWIAEKQALLDGYLDSVTPANVREHYLHGLDLTIKQAFQNRVNELNDASAVNIEITSERIQDIVTAYTVDFYGILKFARQKQLSPLRGVKLAERNFNLSLHEIHRLYSQYEDLPASIISYSLQGQTDPRAFLEKVRNNVANLTATYPDIPKSDIVYAASKYPANPEGFLRKRAKEIKRLTPLFPELIPYDIAYAVVNRPQDPESYLNEMFVRIKKLKQQYPDLPLTVIHLVAPQSEESKNRNIEKFRKERKIDEEKLTREAAEINGEKKD